MKRVLTAALIFVWVWGVSLSGATAGEEKKGKVLTVGKDGLKIDAKITDDDKKYDYKLTLEGMDLDLNLQAKIYSVKLEGGTKYRMTMDTDDEVLDPLLIVKDSDGKIVAYDDDSGGKLNAKLEYTPKKAGTFEINAAVLRGTGPFTLKIVATGKDGGDKEKGKEEKGKEAAAKEIGKDGLTIQAKLSMDDANDKVRKLPCKIQPVKMQAGKTYTIDMISDDFDAYLRLENAAGKELAQDDDSGGDLNVRIVFECKEDGVYRIILTSYDGGQGNFTLKVRAE